MSAPRATIQVMLVVLVLARPAPAWAASGTDRVAQPGEPIAKEGVEHYEWPRGVLELANDPLRANAWHPWFSEWPNDILYFEMNVRGPADVQHLIDQMKKVKTLRRQIVLRPERDYGRPAFTNVPKDANGIGAVFQIGSQPRVDQWYEHLPEIRPGIKGFGMIEYEKVPEALPHTLALYVQHPAVDLEKLEIPTTIQVTAEIDPAFRKEEANRDLIRRIEQFVARHKSRQDAAKKSER